MSDVAAESKPNPSQPIAVFPYPCGEEFQTAVAGGQHPLLAVPNEFIVVRGGLKPLPPTGTTISCSAGPDLASAGCAVPYGQLRWATTGAIRASGGTVTWIPEYSPRGTMNLQHVNVIEGVASAFSDAVSNPVSKADRIDGGKR